ncbi:hypothetical protein F511_04023 [Dorcoceras hygrometricum]|uniref:Uncharacterized protein n=1 Tax=Dorcoceras hygrometricum TaxID=472368 RepID=A0A2Z7AE69_9LAMI|nr:hypothetical protein F511_04023 [Dorcoceras hygrometricum]
MLFNFLSRHVMISFTKKTSKRYKKQRALATIKSKGLHLPRANSIDIKVSA